MSQKNACTLCGLDLGSKPFSLEAKQGTLQFCCEGCQGIYQMLHEDELIDTHTTPPQIKENDRG